MKYKLPSLSICIPVYKGSPVLKEAIASIVKQNYPNYEIVIGDDNPPELKEEIEKTKKIIKSFKKTKFIYIKNKRNLGCEQNLNVITKQASKEIIFLMGQDDVISSDALIRTASAFGLDEDIGAVTRGYFWFDKKISLPVRIKYPVNLKQDEVISIMDDPKKVIGVFQTVDNITGLAYKKKYLTAFHHDVFTTHIHPFTRVFKNHKVVCLKDYTFAARISMSQSRTIKAYRKSPMQSWVDMFNEIFKEKKYADVKKHCIEDFVAVNYVGLMQIKNYATYRDLLKEIFLLLKYRWKNIYNPIFWLFAISTLVLPRTISIPFTDWYKSRINPLFITSVTLK